MRTATFSQHERLSLSYLIIYGIVTFTKYSLYPWILIYLHYRTSLTSWGQIVLGYGLLLSTLYFGEHCGKMMTNSYCLKLSNGFYTAIFLLLAVSYIAIAFVSRFLILIGLFFLVGFTGSMLASFSLNIDKRFPLIHFQKRTSRDAFDPNRSIERSIVFFVFFTLLTAFLYDHRPHVEFPCYYLSLILIVSCVTMLLYYFILQRAISGKKSALSSRLTSTSSASYQSSDSGPGSAGGMGSAGLRPSTASTEVEPTEADLAYAGDVPLNFLNVCWGDIKKARLMYAKMLAWRRQYKVDDIFETPQYGFESIAKYYPHAIHGYSKDGCGVVYEVLGKGKAKELADSGVSIDDIVWHFNLRNEVVFRYLLSSERMTDAMNKAPPGAIQPTPYTSQYSQHPQAMKAPVPRLMTVIDLAGISMSSFSLHVISFLKKSSDTIDNYYPEQVARLVVCNAPSWFSLIWGTIKKVLPDAVQNKVDISYDCSSLDRFIHPSQRPKEYGGTDPTPLGESDAHRFFLSCAEKWKEKIKAAALEQSKSAMNPSSELMQENGQKSNGVLEGGKGKGKGSVFTWLSDRFRKVPSAYLGERNTYKYNATTGKWEMDVDDDVSLLTNHKRAETASSDEENDDEDDDAEESRVERGRGGRKSSQSDKTQLKRADSIDFAMAKARTFSSDKTNLHHSSTSHHHPSLPPPISISSNKIPPVSISTPTSSSTRKRGGKTPKMSKEQLEEHGLVLAIHAAHFASKLSKRNPSDPNNHQPLSISSNQILSRSESGAITANLAVNNMELGIGRSEPLIDGEGRGEGGDDESALNDEASSLTSTSSSSSTSSSNNASSYSKPKVSAKVFLFVSFIFIVIHCIESLVWTLLPVWFSSPLRSGGLGYNVRDLGLLLSSVGMITLQLHAMFGSRADFLLRASPVRALRIGCGIFFLCAFALQLYIRWCTIPIEEALHHLHPLTAMSANSHTVSIHHNQRLSMVNSHFAHSAAGNSLTPELLLMSNDHHPSSLLRSFPTTMETETRIINYLSHVLPSISVVALALPCVLIALIVSSLHLCRKAAGILFHLALTSSFQSPLIIRSTLNTIAEVIGPFFSALLYSIIYSTKLRFPLDSSFFLSFSYSLILIAYMLSLFLSIRFRGDYGIMSDEEEFQKSRGSDGVNGNRGSGQGGVVISAGSEIKSGGKGLHQRHQGSSASGSLDSFSTDVSAGSGIGGQAGSVGEGRPATCCSALTDNVLSVPLGDVSLLMTSSVSSSSYGSKLYNLKDDFKDV